MEGLMWIGVLIGLLTCTNAQMVSEVPSLSRNGEQKTLENSANVSHPTNSTNISTGITSAGYDLPSSPNWSSRQLIHPVVSEPVNRPLSSCHLRLVTWANFTQGSLIIPSQFEVDQLFQSSPLNKQSSLFNQRLQSLTGQSLPLTKLAKHDCYLLFLYSLDCRFSYSAFPEVRALARAYPQFRVYAVRVEDYMAHRWSLRMMYVPKLKLIVDSRVFREYSESQIDLDGLVDFVWTNTRQLPKGPVGLVVSDLDEYPPQPTPKRDWCLIASWIAVLLSMLYFGIIFWDRATRKLMWLVYCLSGGRYGQPPASTTHAGPILGWVPGQISAVH